MTSLQIFKKGTNRDAGTFEDRCASENVFTPFDKNIWNSHFYGRKIYCWSSNILNDQATWKILKTWWVSFGVVANGLAFKRRGDQLFKPRTQNSYVWAAGYANRPVVTVISKYPCGATALLWSHGWCTRYYQLSGKRFCTVAIWFPDKRMLQTLL